MVVLDEDFGTNLTLVEGNGGVRLSPVSVPEHAPRDWRSQCERERARADAAEARAEELRWAEVAARSDGGSWKSRFKACRRRLSEAVEETKEARRTARDVPSLQAEVARLETLLSEAGIASAFDTAGALRKENARLRKALAASKAREGATGPWPAPPRRRTVLEPSPDQKETVRSLRTELRRLDKEVVRRDKENARLNTRLDQEKERTERIRETAKKLSSESLRLHREVRILGDSEARARSLSDEVFWLRHALEVSRAGKEKLKARLAKLRAAGAMLSKLPSDEAAQLRAALRRSRRQKTTIEALRKGNARLRRTVRELETRKAALAVQPAKLRAIRKALESELAGLRAVRKTLSKSLSVADADLRRALRRSRRQKATIKSLSRENARLRKGAKTSRNRIETLEVQLERLRATGAVLSRALYGRKSEQQDKPGSEHKRGQQRGAPGHGRTQRPGLDERTEEHNPPPMRASAAGAGSSMRRTAPRNHPRRDRGQGLQARDPPSALAPDLRVRVVAHGSVGAPGAAAVPQDALRDQLLGTLPVRALCLLPPRAPRCRVDVRPRADGLAGDAGRQPEAVRAAVRAAGRGDPCAPEQGGAAPCRRDQLARPGTSRGRPLEPRLAVGSRSAMTRSLSISTPRAAPRRRRSCSATLSSTRSSSAIAIAPTSDSLAFARAR